MHRHIEVLELHGQVGVVVLSLACHLVEILQNLHLLLQVLLVVFLQHNDGVFKGGNLLSFLQVIIFFIQKLQSKETADSEINNKLRQTFIIDVSLQH